MNDSLCSDALVMPSSSVLPRAGLGFLPLAGSLPAASAASLASLNSALVTTSPSLKLGAAGLGDLHALADQRRCRARNWNLSTTSPGRNLVSPASSTFTLRSIWLRMISMCLSLIFTPCER